MLCSTFYVTPDAAAQFNARGRTRPADKAPPAQASPPRPPAAPGTGPRPPAGSASDSADEARKEVLIERYSALILSQPGEEVPIKRLAQLLRERDGSLAPFLEKLQSDTITAKDAYPYRIARAGLLAEDARTQEALTQLRSATQDSPGRVEGWLLLSHLELQLDQKVEARESLEKALPLVQGPTQIITLRTLRDLCLDQRDIAAAKKYHARLMQGAAGNVFLKGELGRALLERGQTEKAIEELKLVVENSRGDARAMAPAWRDLGGAYLQAERFEHAITALTRASRLAAGQPGLRREIDEQLAQAHRGQGTLAQFLDTLKDGARTAERLELLGRLYEEEGRPDDAAKAYEQALARAPESIDIRLRLVRLFELTGNLERASTHLEALVRKAPSDIHLGLRHMELLLSQGRRKETIRQWDRLETRATEDIEAGLLLVDFAERLGEPHRQRRLLDRLAAHPPTDPRYLVELGSRFYRDGKEEQARKIWRRIVDLRPRDSALHVTLGEVLLDHEAVEAGLEELKKAVQLEPNSTRSRRALALGLERAASLSRKDDRQAYEDLSVAEWEALLRLPSDPSGAKPMARRRIVRIEKRRGTLGARLSRLETKLREQNNDFEMAYLLIEGHLALQNYGKAISTAQQVLKHQKGDRQALLLLERAYEGSANHAKVIATLEQLVAVDPSRAREYYDRMAAAATKQRDFSDALKYAELSVRRNPTDPTANAQLGELYLGQGKTEQAERAFRKALELDDRKHLVALSLAELLSQTKRSDEALPLLFHVVRTATEPLLVQRASRRALSLAVPLGRTEDLAEVLRPLALGHLERPVLRDLLLETLAAQYYPLHQAAQFGSEETRRAALVDLARLAERSTQPLLSALAGEEPESIQVAIDLLAYGSTPAAGQALITFAEGAADDRLRIRAILAAGRTPRDALSRRLETFIFEDDAVLRGALCVAAVWVLARQRDAEAVPLLLRVLAEGSADMRAYAAWGLADRASLGHAEWTRVQSALEETLQTTSSGELARSAAALALGHLFAAPGRSPTQTSRKRALDRLTAAANDRSPLLMRSSLLALALFGDGTTSQNLIGQALFHEDAAVRRAATVAAVGLVSELPSTPLLPERLDAAELDANLHLVRLLASREREEYPRETRFAAFLHFAPALADVAQLSLRTSADSAGAVLARFRSASGAPVFGALLTESDRHAPQSELSPVDAAWQKLRQTLRDEILALAASDDPVCVKALELLRIADGPKATERLSQALSSPQDATYQAALFALVHDASPEAVELLSRSPSDEPWGRRRRRALGLGRIANSVAPAGPAARAQLERMVQDENLLVRQAAQEQLDAAKAAKSRR